MVSTNRLRLTSILLTVTGIFVASNIYTLIPIYNDIALSLHVPQSEIIPAGSLFALFYAVGLLCFGPLSDIIGRKKIIVLGMLASAVSTMFIGFSADPFDLYVSRSIQGITLGSFAPVAFAYSFDLYPPKERTWLLVFINTGFLVAGIFGQLVSSSITINFQWEYTFYFFSSCYFFLFIFLYITLPKTNKPKKQPESAFFIMLGLLKNKNLLKCYAITFTLLFSFVALYDAIGRFFEGTYEELLLLRAVGLIGAILSLFTGQLIERYGAKRTMMVGFLLAIFSLMFMVLFVSLYALIFLTILFIASISLLIPTVITLIGGLGGTNRGKALSLYSFILLTGTSLASPVVLIFGFQQVILLLLILFIFNLISSVFLVKATG